MSPDSDVELHLHIIITTEVCFLCRCLAKPLLAKRQTLRSSEKGRETRMSHVNVTCSCTIKVREYACSPQTIFCGVSHFCIGGLGTKLYNFALQNGRLPELGNQNQSQNLYRQPVLATVSCHVKGGMVPENATCVTINKH